MISDPIVDMLSKNSDVGGNGDVVELSLVPPRTPPPLLSSLHNPHMCGGTTSSIGICSMNFTRRAVTRRDAARTPPSSYLGRGLMAGIEAVSSPSLIQKMDLMWWSLIQATIMMTSS